MFFTFSSLIKDTTDSSVRLTGAKVALSLIENFPTPAINAETNFISSPSRSYFVNNFVDRKEFVLRRQVQDVVVNKSRGERGKTLQRIAGRVERPAAE